MEVKVKFLKILWVELDTKENFEYFYELNSRSFAVKEILLINKILKEVADADFSYNEGILPDYSLLPLTQFGNEFTTEILEEKHFYKKWNEAVITLSQKQTYISEFDSNNTYVTCHFPDVSEVFHFELDESKMEVRRVEESNNGFKFTSEKLSNFGEDSFWYPAGFLNKTKTNYFVLNEITQEEFKKLWFKATNEFFNSIKNKIK